MSYAVAKIKETWAFVISIKDNVSKVAQWDIEQGIDKCGLVGAWGDEEWHDDKYLWYALCLLRNRRYFFYEY